MSDLFQEVEDEYRREQMAKFWEKYRMAVVGGAAALVVAVAGFQGWTYWRARQIENSSRGLEAVVQMLQSGQTKEASEALGKIASNGSGGYPLVAKLQEAALRAEGGETKAAVTLYDSIAGSGSGGQLISDFATLRASILVSESAPFDDLKKRLEPIASGEGPWRLQAKELLAYTSWRAGKKDEALKLYGEVKDAPEVTAGTKRRSIEMSALISAGMKPADVKVPAGLRAPGISEPLLPQPLLPQPLAPTPDANSLLGPNAPTEPSDPASLLGPNPPPQQPSP